MNGSNPAVFRISESIRHSDTQDGAILLDLHLGQMFSLNVVGARMVGLLGQGLTESEIVDEISRDFEVDKDVVRRDLRDFIQDLDRQHILQPAGRIEEVPLKRETE